MWTTGVLLVLTHCQLNAINHSQLVANVNPGFFLNPVRKHGCLIGGIPFKYWIMTIGGVDIIYIAIDGEYGSLMFFIFLWKICRNISSEMVEMKMRRTCRGIDLQLRLPWVLPFHLSRKTEKLQTPARTTWSSIPCTAIQIYIIII
jgi:hypothetical protein